MTGAPIYKIAALSLQHTARLVPALCNLVDVVARAISEAETRSRSIVGRVHNKLDPQFCTGQLGFAAGTGWRVTLRNPSIPDFVKPGKI